MNPGPRRVANRGSNRSGCSRHPDPLPHWRTGRERVAPAGRKEGKDPPGPMGAGLMYEQPACAHELRSYQHLAFQP